MLKSEQKKLVLAHIDPVLKSAGYKIRHSDGVRYYLNQNGLTISWVLIFYNMSFIDSQGVQVTHQEVEEILQRVADENYPRSWDIHRQTLLTPTIIDNAFIDAFDTVIIRDEAQADAVATSYLDYILGAGKDFVERYSYLPNVLKRMHELVAEGLSWQYEGEGILYGGIDAFLRGLIISKLCNDPNFDAKLADCDERFRGEAYKRWVPYYEKLKAEILPTIEPKYNL